MKRSLLKKSSYLVLSLLWLIPSASRTKEQTPVLKLSKQERNEITENLEVPYAYLGRELSDITEIVRQISDLCDNDEAEGVCELRNHVNAGYKIGRCDATVEVLMEALSALEDDKKSEKLAVRLKDNIEKLQNGELNIEAVTEQSMRMQSDQVEKGDDVETQLLAQGMPIVIEEEDITRDPVIEKIEGCLEVTNDTLIGRNLTVENDLLVKDDATIRGDLIVKDELEVCGKAKFKKKVKFKKDVKFEKDVEIEDDLEVEGDLEVFGNTELKDVEIDGNLSVIEDLVVCGDAEFKGSVVDVACDLVVGCNIFMKDTNSPVGNIYKEGTRFIHNFGTDNTFVGKGAGNFIMTGDSNSSFGVGALTSNTTGRRNTAVGTFALPFNTTGVRNTAVGALALLFNTTGSANTAVGAFALTASTGGQNTAFGDAALPINTTGNQNTAMGHLALFFNKTGSDNTAIGKDVLLNATGNRNIGIGKAAGINLTSGDDNIYIGSDAGFPPDDSVTESLQIRIGELGIQTDCYIQGIFGATIDSVIDLPVFVDADGKLGTAASSEQYKSNIIDMGAASDDLMNLRPVKFTYKHDNSNKQHYGLIAEEVEEVYPELVVHDSSGNTYSVRYHELPAMLLNELQKNREIIKTLQSTVKDLLTKQEGSNAFIKELLARIVVLEELTGR